MDDEGTARRQADADAEREDREKAAAYEQGRKDALDGHAGRLIDVWVDLNKRPCPWRIAVEITAVICRLPDAERDRLLALEND